MKIAIHIILITLFLNMPVVFCQETGGDSRITEFTGEASDKISPYLKPLEYGLSMFTVFDSRNKKSSNLSIIPENINRLIKHAEMISKKLNPDKVAIRIIYVTIPNTNNTKTINISRGVFLGLEFENNEGTIKRKMYKFDEEESSFIEKSIRN